MMLRHPSQPARRPSVDAKRCWPNCKGYLVALMLLIVFLGCNSAIAESEEDVDVTFHQSSRIDHLRDLVHVPFDNDDEDEDVEAALGGDAESAAAFAMERIGASLQERMTTMFAKAKTPECRKEIAQHFGYFVNALGLEESLPFTDVHFQNDCGEEVYIWKDLPEEVNPGDIQNRTYQPPRNETEYIDDPANLKLCFAIMTHDNPAATIRLIEALYEDGHVFVVHVDGKEIHDDTQAQLMEYASTRPYVHVLEHPYRVRVNWGGFSMVNATLQLLRYAMGIDKHSGRTQPLDFHKFVHLSSSSYPIACNSEIRHRIASYPLDANMVNIVMQPTRPKNYVWHYFVECDDALHRIYQLPGLQTATAGAELFTSSQWFLLSREFAQYLADPPAGSFVEEYIKYAQHVVVADETFFGTVLRHTTFCKKHHNQNFLHLQFDRWESELPAHKRDERKCPMPNPDHCGRSPTIMTVDYADILELSDALFARKFDDSVDSHVKDIIDDWRSERERLIADGADVGDVAEPKSIDFEGHGVLILAKETANASTPLCLGLGPTGNSILLTPCFHDVVPPTLGENWETGGVIIQETKANNRWNIGPCTSDGTAKRLDTGQMSVTKGNYSTTGPRCMLKQRDGMRAGRCYDSQSESLQPGGDTRVYPCWGEKWYQFISFGDGEVAPLGSLYSTLPLQAVKQIQNLGHDQIPYMCLGVYGRGDQDEEDWHDKDHSTRSKGSAKNERKELAPLTEFQGSEIITTQCSNVGAVIEWAFVPYIVEDDEPDEKDDGESDDQKDQHDAKNEQPGGDEL